MRWFFKLPWGDPVVAAQILAMLVFAFGGIGGLVNASYSINLLVHNTAYIVGHFHLTVGTAVTLSFMGITYWLVPVLRGRGLWSQRLALWQVWLWVIGMVLFSSTLHGLGLDGMPRRTMISMAPYIQPEWRSWLPLVGIGGSLMFLSALLYFLNLLMTCRGGTAARPGDAGLCRGPLWSRGRRQPYWIDHGLLPWLICPYGAVHFPGLWPHSLAPGSRTPRLPCRGCGVW